MLQSDGKQRSPSSSQRSRHRCNQGNVTIAIDWSRTAVGAPPRCCAAAAHPHCHHLYNERLEGSPRSPSSRITTQKGASGSSLVGNPLAATLPSALGRPHLPGLRTARAQALACGPRNRCSGPRGSPGTAGSTACARVRGQPPGQPRARHHGGDHGRRQPETEIREDAREKTTPARVRSCVEIKSQAPHAIDATSSL